MTRKAKAAKALSTEIVVLLDRSGSMQSIKNDMINGFDGFIEAQRKVPDQCRVTLVQFDTQGTDIVYEAKDLADVPGLAIEPRGGTPLLDATGNTIGQVTDRLAKTQGTARPDRVLFLVMTDGEENSSKTFSKSQIAALVKERTVDGWQFSFLGANIDAFADAGSLGIAASSTANFISDSAGVQHAFTAMTVGAMSFRGGAGYSLSNADPRVLQHQRSASSTLGSLGGKKGGDARARSLTPEQKTEIAKKGATARWQKAPDVP